MPTLFTIMKEMSGLTFSGVRNIPIPSTKHRELHPLAPGFCCAQLM